MTVSYSRDGITADLDIFEEFSSWWIERFKNDGGTEAVSNPAYMPARLVNFHRDGVLHEAPRTITGETTPISELVTSLREIGPDSFTVELSDIERGLGLRFAGSFRVGFGSVSGTIRYPKLYTSDRPTTAEVAEYEIERLAALEEFFKRYPLTELNSIEPDFRVFLGHGHGSDWKIIQAAVEAAGYPVVAYESGAIAGETAIKIISDMIRESSAAVIYATPDDTMQDGSKRARQNVIHEIGLAQGALGPLRTVIVQHSDVVMPTNLAGVNVVLHRPSGLGDVLEQITHYLEKARDVSRP
jgi:hypothetical protein